MKNGTILGIGTLIIGVVVIFLFLLNLTSFGILLNRVSQSPFLIVIMFILIWLILSGKKRG